MTPRSNPLFASRIKTPQKIVDSVEAGYKFCMMLLAAAHSMWIELNKRMAEWKTNVEKTDKARIEGRYEDIEPEYNYTSPNEYTYALHVMFKMPLNKIKELIDRYSFMRAEIYLAIEELKQVLRHYEHRQYESIPIELRKKFENIGHDSKELIAKMKNGFLEIDIERAVDEHALRMKEKERIETLKTHNEQETGQTESKLKTQLMHRDVA